MTSRDTEIYGEVVIITADYLGPASQRFIDRQIQNHLHKSPGKLSRQDVIILKDWATLALALLTENEKYVKEFSQRLSSLTEKSELPL